MGRKEIGLSLLLHLLWALVTVTGQIYKYSKYSLFWKYCASD